MTFSHKEKIRTPFGGFCSIVFIAFSIWAIYFGSQNLLFKLNPRVVITEAFSENPRPMLLTEQNFPVAFALQAPDAMSAVAFTDKSIYHFELVLSVFSRTEGSNGKITTVYEEIPVDLETCTLSHFGDMASSFTHFQLDDMVCIARKQSKIERILLQGNFDSVYTYVSLTVKLVECDSSDPSAGCASSTVKDQYLNGAWFNVIYTNMVVDSNNYENPNSRFRDLFYSMINRNNYISVSLGLTHVNVTTDSGWLLESTETKEYIKVGEAIKSIQTTPYGGNVLARCDLQVSKLESLYFRSYDKVQNVFADMGSLISAAFLIVFFIMSPYTKLKIREALMNELFHIFYEPKPDQKSKKNTKVQEKELEKLESEAEGPGTRLELQTDQEEPLHRQATSVSSGTPLSTLRKGTTKTSLPSNTSRKTKEENKPANIFKDKPLNIAATSPGSSSQPLKKGSPNKNQPHHLREIYNESPIFALGKIPNEPWTGYRRGPPSNFHNRKVAPGDTDRESLADVALDEEIGRNPSKSQTLTAIKLELSKADHRVVHISFFEYIRSFVYKSEALEKKMELLTQGVQNIDERLDVINIMKKLREVDKLKALFLDDNQLTLFNHLPKPEIRPKSKRRLSFEQAFLLGLLASSKFVEGDKSEEAILSTYELIKNKQDMTEMDRKLIEIFEKKNQAFVKK